MLRGEEPRKVRLPRREAFAWFGASAVIIASPSARAIADPGVAEASCNVPKLDAPRPAATSRLSADAQAELDRLATPGAAATGAEATAASSALSHSEHGPAPSAALSSGDQTLLDAQLAARPRRGRVGVRSGRRGGRVRAGIDAGRRRRRPLDRLAGSGAAVRPGPAVDAAVRSRPPRRGTPTRRASATGSAAPRRLTGSRARTTSGTSTRAVLPDGWMRQGPSTPNGCADGGGRGSTDATCGCSTCGCRPTAPNRWGTFAVLNPALCPPRTGTPDILAATPTPSEVAMDRHGVPVLDASAPSSGDPTPSARRAVRSTRLSQTLLDLVISCICVWRVIKRFIPDVRASSSFNFPLSIWL